MAGGAGGAAFDPGESGTVLDVVVGAGCTGAVEEPEPDSEPKAGGKVVAGACELGLVDTLWRGLYGKVESGDRPPSSDSASDDVDADAPRSGCAIVPPCVEGRRSVSPEKRPGFASAILVEDVMRRDK